MIINMVVESSLEVIIPQEARRYVIADSLLG